MVVSLVYVSNWFYWYVYVFNIRIVFFNVFRVMYIYGNILIVVNIFGENIYINYWLLFLIGVYLYIYLC